MNNAEHDVKAKGVGVDATPLTFDDVARHPLRLIGTDVNEVPTRKKVYIEASARYEDLCPPPHRCRGWG